MSKSSKTGQDNRANQLNPNNDAYWQSRGESGPPTEQASAPATPLPIPTAPGEKEGDSK